MCAIDDKWKGCVEAGLSFEAAVARVAAGQGPLAEELARVLQDIQIGMPRDRALESLLERTDVADLRAFVHSFMHADRYGIPIAHVLRPPQNGDLMTSSAREVMNPLQARIATPPKRPHTPS